MKKSLIATLVAAPLLSLSSLAFAAEPAAAEPMLLTASQMDGVTAGWYEYVFNRANVTQVNVSPVTLVQLSGINVSSGGGANAALIDSGNSSSIRQ